MTNDEIKHLCVNFAMHISKMYNEVDENILNYEFEKWFELYVHENML